MNVNIFQGDTIANLKNLDRGFLGRDDVKQAREDFRYLVGALGPGHGTANNLDFLAIEKNYVKIANCFVVPFDTKARTTRFPAGFLDSQLTMIYVAVICYKNGKAVDALMFNAERFIKLLKQSSKFKLLSVFKRKTITFDEKTNEYVIKINNIKDMLIQRHAFGVVVTSLGAPK